MIAVSATARLLGRTIDLRVVTEGAGSAGTRGSGQIPLSLSNGTSAAGPCGSDARRRAGRQFVMNVPQQRKTLFLGERRLVHVLRVLPPGVWTWILVMW
ncbi:MAG: hypothetical protein OXE75_06105, partial [bacterium]|nr:hypothetical protein [bacterium]